MSENIKSFISIFAGNKEMREKIETADAASIEQDILPLARGAGFDFTAGEFMAYLTALRTVPAELSDDELEKVTGAGPILPPVR